MHFILHPPTTPQALLIVDPSAPSPYLGVDTLPDLHSAMSDSHAPVHKVDTDIDGVGSSPRSSPAQRHHAYATLAPAVGL